MLLLTTLFNGFFRINLLSVTIIENLRTQGDQSVESKPARQRKNRVEVESVTLSHVQRPLFHWSVIEIQLLHYISCSDDTNHTPACPSLCSLWCLRVRQKSRSSSEFMLDE